MRLSRISALIGIAALTSLFPAPSFASVDFLVTPKARGARGDGTLRSSLARALPGVRVEAVFSKDERDAIEKLGDPTLGASLKVTLEHETDRKTFESIARQNGWTADPRREDARLQEATLEDLQWGLRNLGSPIQTLLTDTSRAEIPGEAGEDIGVSRAKPLAPSELHPVTVAVLDTGIDSKHPAFAARIVRSQIPVGDSMVGDPMTDEVGHGTHVAGIIAASTASGSLTSGVAPSVLILPVKVIKRAPNAPIRPQALGAGSDGPGGAFADTIARGLLYAVRSGAQVANLSLAWPTAADSLLMRRTVALARSNGMLIVAASGNDSTQALSFPCAYDGVICVGAHGPDGALSHFSNFGAQVEVAAPGISILSTYPLKNTPINFTAAQGYESKSGTSMASPFVAGVLAELLARGFTTEEARARLLAGTRPVREPSWESPEYLAFIRKWVSFGNVDLARSITAEPAPLFERASKAILEPSFDPNPKQRVSASTAFSLSVKNSWAPANSPVDVQALLLAYEGTSAVSARLETSSWKFPSWAQGQVREFSASLLFPSDLSRVDSRMLIELRFHSNGQSLGTVRFPIRLVRRIALGTVPSGATSSELPSGLSSSATFRSVLPRDGSSDIEYLAISPSSTQGQLDLHRVIRVSSSPTTTELALKATATIPTPKGTLYVVERLPGSRIAMTLNLPNANGSVPTDEIRVFSPTLELERTITYDNKISALPESYRWMKTSKDSGLLSPAWIGRGTTPTLEKKPFDPWDPTPSDLPAVRFYFLSAEGVRSIAAPDGYDWVAVMASTDEDLAHGRVRAIVEKGDRFVVDYAMVTVAEGEVSTPTPLPLREFRALDIASQKGRIQALSPGFEGQYFAGESTHAHLRATLLFSGRESWDVEQGPVSHFDTAISITGVFAGPEGSASFLETHTSLQYADHSTGEIALTDLGRYSFVSPLIFSSTFSPVFGWDDARGSRKPAIYVPSELGAPDGFEIIEPVRDAKGKLKLLKPALLHFALAEGADADCAEIGNPIEVPEAASRIAFVCGTRWIEIPLSGR